jgi:hypothetical protein
MCRSGEETALMIERLRLCVRVHRLQSLKFRERRNNYALLAAATMRKCTVRHETILKNCDADHAIAATAREVPREGRMMTADSNARLPAILLESNIPTPVMVPGDQHWPIFESVCQQSQSNGNVAQDAWFAALAIEFGCEWITTDRDYARFEGLIWRASF